MESHKPFHSNYPQPSYYTGYPQPHFYHAPTAEPQYQMPPYNPQAQYSMPQPHFCNARTAEPQHQMPPYNPQAQYWMPQHGQQFPQPQYQMPPYNANAQYATPQCNQQFPQPQVPMPQPDQGLPQPSHDFPSSMQLSHQSTPLQHYNYGQTQYYNGPVNYYVPHSRAKKSDFRPTPSKTKATTHASSAVVFETTSQGEARTRSDTESQNLKPPRKKQKVNSTPNIVPASQMPTPTTRQASPTSETTDISRNTSTNTVATSFPEPQTPATDAEMSQALSEKGSESSLHILGTQPAPLGKRASTPSNRDTIGETPSLTTDLKKNPTSPAHVQGPPHTPPVESASTPPCDRATPEKDPSSTTVFGEVPGSPAFVPEPQDTPSAEDNGTSHSERAISSATEIIDNPCFPPDCSLEHSIRILAKWLEMAFPHGVDLDTHETLKAKQISMLQEPLWYDDCIMLHLSQCLKPHLKRDEEIFVPGYINTSIRPDTTVVYYVYNHGNSHWMLVKVNRQDDIPFVEFYDGYSLKIKDRWLTVDKILQNLDTACGRQFGDPNSWQSSLPIIEERPCDKQSDDDSCGPRVMTIIEHMVTGRFDPNTILVNEKMRQHHFNLLWEAIKRRPDQNMQTVKRKALREPHLPGLGDIVVRMTSSDDRSPNARNSDSGKVAVVDPNAVFDFNTYMAEGFNDSSQDWWPEDIENGTFYGFSQEQRVEIKNYEDSSSDEDSEASNSKNEDSEHEDSEREDSEQEDSEDEDSEDEDSEDEDSEDEDSEDEDSEDEDSEDEDSEDEDSEDEDSEDDEPEDESDPTPMPQIPPVPEYDPSDVDYVPSEQGEMPKSPRRSKRTSLKRKQYLNSSEPSLRSKAESAFSPTISRKPSLHNLSSGLSDKKERYPCPYAESHSCSKTFSYQHGATRHGNLHTGVGRVTCPSCQKTFSRQDALSCHKPLCRGPLSDESDVSIDTDIGETAEAELERNYVRSWHKYEHEGVHFELQISLDELTSMPKNWCAYRYQPDKSLAFWHILLHADEAKLQRAWQYYLDRFAQHTVADPSTGCHISNRVLLLNALELRKCLCGCGKAFSGKVYGSSSSGPGSRVQNCSHALKYAMNKDWLGLAKVLLAVDSKHDRLHMSHLCASPREGYTCWDFDHACKEPSNHNFNRQAHHSGRRVCNDAEHGRRPCLSNGQIGIPVKENGKIVRWIERDILKLPPEGRHGLKHKVNPGRRSVDRKVNKDFRDFPLTPHSESLWNRHRRRLKQLYVNQRQKWLTIHAEMAPYFLPSFEVEDFQIMCKYWGWRKKVRGETTQEEKDKNNAYRRRKAANERAEKAKIEIEQEQEIADSNGEETGIEE